MYKNIKYKIKFHILKKRNIELFENYYIKLKIFIIII